MEQAGNITISNKRRHRISDRCEHGNFTTTDVFREINSNYLNSHSCMMWIVKKLHPGGARCPSCLNPIQATGYSRYLTGQQIRCNKCGKFFTVLTGTFLSGTHMEYHDIFFLAFLLELGLSTKQISEKMTLDPDTIRLWKAKFDLVRKSKEL